MTTVRKTFYYGWVVVVVTVLTLLISSGVRSAPGVFLLPLNANMGWSRSAISFAVSLGLTLFGLAGPFGGALMSRYGPRPLMLAGLLLTGLSTVVSAWMTELWQLYVLWGALSGIGTGLTAAVLSAAVANRWFVAQRGLVTGIFGAATSAGQLVFIPLLSWLVGTYGWRDSTLWLGGITLAVLLPVLLLMRNDPADIGLRPYGAPDASVALTADTTTEGGVMRRALRSPAFWLLTGTFFVCGFSSNGLIGVHFIPYAVDCGLTEGVAAGSLALMGMFNFVGTIGSGWLTDRYDPRKLLCIYYGFRGLSLLLLPFVNDPIGMSVFAVLFGLDYIATVPPTTALVADTFGRKHVGTVFGWVFCAHQIGAAIAAWFGGTVRDSLGSYGVAFLAAGVLAIAAGLLSLRIARAAKPTPSTGVAAA